MLGSYQQKNLKTAVTTIEQLKSFEISQTNIKEGLLNVVKSTNLKGRWQVLKEVPKVVCDTAHNKEGLTYVLNQLKEEKYNQLHIVLGVVSDKDLEQILPMFPEKAKYYFCKPNIPRGLAADVLQNKAKNYGLKGEMFSSVNQAYKKAISNASRRDMIYVGGSTFVVAEVL